MRTQKIVVATAVAFVVLFLTMGCGPTENTQLAQGPVVDENGMFIEADPVIRHEDNIPQGDIADGSGLDATDLVVAGIAGAVVGEILGGTDRTVVKERTVVREKPVYVKPKKKKKLFKTPVERKKKIRYSKPFKSKKRW